MNFSLLTAFIPLGIGDFFNKIGDFFSSIPEAIGSSIINAITTVVGKGLYYLIVKGLLSIVNVIYQLFEVFAGVKEIDYDGTKNYLINVFFENTVITNIYWGMACIGMAMMFGFAIIAVIRKIFDIDDKHQRSLGSILKNCFKSIFTILVLSLCVSGVLNGTNVLMRSVWYLFDNAEAMSQITYIEYTDQQYASMARVINTIGNFSLNPSYDSRYNINSCFNEIRADLYDLQDQGVFAGHYETVDENGKTVVNWMTMLQEIVESADLSQDVDMDIYYESVSTAIINAMKTLQNNPNISALKSYTFPNYSKSSEVSIDRALFLTGTTHAARDSVYNENASFVDAVRGPYYSGEKSIYDLEEVNSSFNIRVGSIDYVLIAVLAFLSIKYLLRCILQCAGRIFQMVALYIVAPPFIATMPWDDGEKFKQWTTSFIIQCFGVFGTVIPMRLLITFVPIILSDELVIFADSSFLNIISKVLLIVGSIFAVDSFSQIFSGILAGNASWVSSGANSSMGAVADRMFSAGTSIAGGVASAGLKLGGGVAKGALSGAATLTGLTTVGNKISSGLSSVGASIEQGWNNLKSNGGIPGVLAGVRSNLPAKNDSIGKPDKGPDSSAVVDSGEKKNEEELPKKQ